MPTDDPVIRTTSLEKTYRADGVETQALSGVDLVLHREEFAALAGPSGSGKSTLLHLVGGLLSPSAGTISLNGHQLNEMDADDLAEVRLREIGFVFQAYNLIPVLTVLENAAFVMELQGVPFRRRRDRAMDVLNTLGVDTLVDQFPNKLSGGQQQRVAVARAVAPGPSLVLADEPTANLDSKTGHNLIELMRELNRERGVTFLFATHDERLLGNVDRVVYLEDGRISSDQSRS
ncbi:MAG: ABC transporter ATP-binding protein [Candidatus Bipolaricaulia bacterium]